VIYCQIVGDGRDLVDGMLRWMIRYGVLVTVWLEDGWWAMDFGLLEYWAMGGWRL
jgi:hypothetical protein